MVEGLGYGGRRGLPMVALSALCWFSAENESGVWKPEKNVN